MSSIYKYAASIATSIFSQKTSVNTALTSLFFGTLGENRYQSLVEILTTPSKFKYLKEARQFSATSIAATAMIKAFDNISKLYIEDELRKTQPSTRRSKRSFAIGAAVSAAELAVTAYFLYTAGAFLYSSAHLIPENVVILTTSCNIQSESYRQALSFLSFYGSIALSNGSNLIDKVNRCALLSKLFQKARSEPPKLFEV